MGLGRAIGAASAGGRSLGPAATLPDSEFVPGDSNGKG